MPFGSLSPEAKATVLLQLKGAAQYIKQMGAATASTLRLGAAVTEEGMAATVAARKNFVLSQAIYTLRRYTYFGTLALVGLGVAAVKMGFDFDASMQTATVSLERFTGSTQIARQEAQKLYVFAARTPFEFNDVALAARRLLPAFNGDLGQTNQLLYAVGNSLAAFGTVSGANLSRATLALAHMMSIGHVTGQTLQQLAKDNIPLQRVLQKEFGATGQQIQDAVRAGAISSQDAIEALVRFMNSEKGFKGAARALASKTLTGAWTTFHDLVAASFGTSEQGLFSGATKALVRINNYLLNLVNTGKQLNVTTLFGAFDAAFTPKTHRLMHAFITLRTAMQDVWNSLKFGRDVLNTILWPVQQLTQLFGNGASSAKLYGHFLAVLIDLWILQKSVTIAAAIATGIYNLVTGKTIGLDKTLLLLRKAEAFWTAAFATETVTLATAEKISLGQRFTNMSLTARFIRFIRLSALPALATFASTLWGVFFGESAVAVGLGAITIPLWAVVGAIAALTLGFVVLYYKWKPFHDLVNETFNYVMSHKEQVAQALVVAFGPLGTILQQLVFIINNINALKNLAGTAVHPNRWSLGGFGRFIGGQALGFAGSLGVPVVPAQQIGGFVYHHVPHAQSGGTVSSGGLVTVGESGREIVNLPKGAQITPHHQIQTALAGPGGAIPPIQVNLMLREKVLESVVVDLIARRNARS